MGTRFCVRRMASLAAVAVAGTALVGIGAAPAAADHGPCEPESAGTGSEAAIEAGYIDGAGAVDVVALFVDFSDAPADEASPAQVVDYRAPIADGLTWLEDRSYGRLDFRLRSVDRWLRMPRAEGGYGNQESDFQTAAFARDAVDLADPELDFSGVEILILVPPANAGSFGRAFAMDLQGDDVITADGTEIQHGVLNDKWLVSDSFLVTSHEVGHNLGLPDTYLLSGVDANEELIGGWDVMGLLYGHSPDLFGWHKLLMGWIDARDVACVVDVGTTEVALAPLAAAQGTRMAVVPLNDTRLIAIEYRDASSPAGSEGVCSTGVLVYEVDQTVPSGEGPVRVHDAHPDTTPPGDHCLDLDDAPLVAGETMTVSGTDVEIAVDSLANRATLRITRPSAAAEPSRWERMAGDSRITTAVEASRAQFPNSMTSAVVLARADGFADALAGTPLAVTRNAPMLLTHGDELPVAVSGEIYRILAEPGTVYVLGGESAISEAVVDQLRELPLEGLRVQRIGGADRYDTAALVAEELGNPDNVLLASGRAFPDAVTAGAAATVVGGVILLTADDQPVDVTSEYLAAHPGGKRWAIGGPAARAYPDAVPVMGADRYATSVAVATTFFDTPHHVGLARGDDFPDSLAGGGMLGQLEGPVLITPADRLSSATHRYLCTRVPTQAQALAFGGPVALAPATIESAVDAISGAGCPSS